MSNNNNNKTTKWEKKWHKMADLELITSTVALNVNEQSFLIKGKLSISLKQQDPTICWLQKMTFMKRHTELKSKKDEKIIYHANTIHNKAEWLYMAI